MFRCTKWISTVVLMCATAMSVAAIAQTETAPPDSAVVLITPEMAAAAAVAASPLDREVATIRDAFHSRLTELTARYGAATGRRRGRRRTTGDRGAQDAARDSTCWASSCGWRASGTMTAAIAELEQSLTAARARLVADTGLEAPAAPAGSVTR